jgi:nucleotide-binding universal stress UspA family protein
VPPSATPTDAVGFASILVPMDLNSENERRVGVAVSLADRFSSRLFGVAAQPVPGPLYFEAPAPNVDTIVALEERRITEELKKAEAVFRRVASRHDRLEWRHAIAFPDDFVLKHARSADLIVAGSRPRGDQTHSEMRVDPGDLVLNAGRPILFVPPNVGDLAGKRIVVGWKDTREARRAVMDSLPLLKRADDVFVISIDHQEASDDALTDVAAYLACHGVNAHTRAQPISSISVGDELIRIAERENADLIVCGAYGHSRAREWVLGGVTRDLLDHAPVCCLMAH